MNVTAKCPAWKYFEKNTTDIKTVKCKLCYSNVPRATGTSNIWSHLKNHHHSYYVDLKKKG